MGEARCDRGESVKRWISVCESTPDNWTGILVFDPTTYRRARFAYYECGEWYSAESNSDGEELTGVTHWRHLPDPPNATAGGQ